MHETTAEVSIYTSISAPRFEATMIGSHQIQKGLWPTVFCIYSYLFVSWTRPHSYQVRNCVAFFCGFPVLSIFLAICSILELEGAISTVFAAFFEFKPLIFHGICNMLGLLAAFWSWKLPCQRYLQQFWVRTWHFPWNLQHFGARTVHFRLVLGLV